jgi:chemotaxis protein MotB
MEMEFRNPHQITNQKRRHTMHTAGKKTIIILIALMATILFTGCTNWQKKYEALNVEHQNLRGLLERERTEKGRLAAEVTQGHKTINELQEQIAGRNQSPAEATGFGEGYNVAFDAAAGTITVTLQNAILFVGHTDSDPIRKSKWKDNWELSAQRALSVVRYLIAKGIDKEKIRAVGCGATKPVASNSTRSGKARNRRVEIVVHMK